MKRFNCRFAVLSDLAAPTAPRAMTTQMIRTLIQQHRPKSTAATILAEINDLVTFKALCKVNWDTYLNLHCTPPATYADAAVVIDSRSIVSSLSVLLEAGVIPLDRDSKKMVITSVRQNYARLLDSAVEKGEDVDYSFQVLPDRFFKLQDFGDVIDPTKPFPCFTPEKAFLDYLYIEDITHGHPRQISDWNLEKLDMEKLASIANRLKIRVLLDEYLTKFDEVGCQQSRAEIESIPGVVRDPEKITDLLHALRRFWVSHLDYSLSEVLMEIRPKNASLYFPDVADQEWWDGIAVHDWALRASSWSAES